MSSRNRIGVHTAVLLVLAFSPPQAQAAAADLDPTFNSAPAVLGQIAVFAVQGDGKILVGRSISEYHPRAYRAIERLNADGTVDSSFRAEVAAVRDTLVQAVAVQSDGRVLIGGRFDRVNGAERPDLARLNADGSLDHTFLQGLEGPAGFVDTIAIQADGRILVGGFFTSVNGVPTGDFVRLHANG